MANCSTVDLTPVNVFVCDGARLKLGDFGIVRQQSHRRGVTARTLNRSMVPSEMLAGDAPKWRARDDVVRGRPNPLQAAGREGGLKLMEIKRLRAKGHHITLIDEARFWRLVGRRARA